MGFLDKLQQTAKDTLDKGKDKLEDIQADKKADQLLRDLGAWYYAGRTGRDAGDAAGNVERLVAELQAHEAEHGPMGQKAHADSSNAPSEAAAAPTDADPTPAPPAAAPAPPPPPADASSDAPPTPPVTSGPPPPPED